MSHRSHLKETEEDLVPKQKAWAGCRKRIESYAKQYAEGHVVGESPTDDQKAILQDAKNEGYPKSIVKTCGDLMRRIDKAKEEDKAELIVKRTTALRDYANDLGLGQAFS